MREVGDTIGDVVGTVIFMLAATLIILLFNYTSDITGNIRKDFRKNSVSQVNMDEHIAEIIEEKTYTSGEAARQIEASKVPTKINGVSVALGESYYYYFRLLGNGNEYKREYVLDKDGNVSGIKYQKSH